MKTKNIKRPPAVPKQKPTPRPRLIRSARTWAGFLLACFVACLLPSFALAGKTHVFTGTSFGPEGPSGLASFANPQAVAVDQATQDVYVYDTGEAKIFKFDSGGEPVNFSGLAGNAIEGVFGAGSGENEIAVAPAGSPAGTAGDIYVAHYPTVAVYAPSGEPLGQLTSNEVCGVATDAAGHVFTGVYEQTIQEFTPSTNPPTGADLSASSTGKGLVSICDVAADGLGNVYAARFSGEELFKLEGLADESSTVISPGGRTLAVDPASNDLYADGGGEVFQYSSAGSLISKFGAGRLSGSYGVAVNAGSGDVYVANQGKVDLYGPTVALPEATTEAATAIDQESATLHGTVGTSGGPEASCEFQYLTEAAFQANKESNPAGDGFEGATATACTPPGPFSSTTPVSAKVTGLSSATTYRFRVLATNTNGTTFGEPVGLFVIGQPVISGESASTITASTARIGAQVNPTGAPTTFVVEYVTTSQFLEDGYAHATTVPTPARDAGAGTAPVAVIQQLTGLTEDTAYHYRITATNSVNTVRSPDQTFSTYPKAPAGGLPDDRLYEMISPPEKLGEVMPPEPNSSLGGSCEVFCLPGINSQAMPMQTAPGGEAVLYQGQAFTAGLASGPNEYVSRRGPSGWDRQNLSTPLFANNSGQGYEAFSSDLSRAVIYQFAPALSPEAPAREGESFANLYLREPDGTLHPLITTAPPHRGPGHGSQGENHFEVRFSGANAGTAAAPAFEHLVFEANDTLTPSVPGVAPQAPEVPSFECAERKSNCDLYEWSTGGLHLVNVLPGNTTAALHAVIGSGRLLVPSVFEGPAVDHAISADGSRIFWSSEETGHVYARIDAKETLEVPGPATCKESVPPEQRACFVTASADGARVLLSNGEIYQLDEAGTAYEPATDLTEGHAGFQGVLGAAEDLSHVYFVDTAILTSEERNANGEEAVEEQGKFNLYAWHAGAVKFIGTLLEHDNFLGANGRYGDWKASRPNGTAQVSPDGSQLAFMSQAPLTGYDNTLAGGGKCTPSPSPGSCDEVFEYAAGAESLTCASCDPTGQRPIGPSNLSLIKAYEGRPPFPQPGNLTADGSGRLFFESGDVLSPQDTNGRIQDVYEWEPNGVGSCTRAGGCQLLISSGHSANDSLFVDSTPSGNDAFFITREQLLPQDKDQRLDLYDARVGGGFAAPGETAACSGDGCRGPLAGPPAPESPASSIFTGPGNFALTITSPPPGKPPLTRAQKLAKALKACAKKPKRNRRSCRTQARKRYGPVKANKTTSKSHKGGR
jgi:hypothetical protein